MPTIRIFSFGVRLFVVHVIRVQHLSVRYHRLLTANRIIRCQTNKYDRACRN